MCRYEDNNVNCFCGLKTRPSPHKTRKKFKKAKLNLPFGFGFGKDLGREMSELSWRHWFLKASQRFQILPV